MRRKGKELKERIKDEINFILYDKAGRKELKERMKEGINKFPYYIPDMNKGIKRRNKFQKERIKERINFAIII